MKIILRLANTSTNMVIDFFLFDTYNLICMQHAHYTFSKNNKMIFRLLKSILNSIFLIVISYNYYIYNKYSIQISYICNNTLNLISNFNVHLYIIIPITYMAI